MTPEEFGRLAKSLPLDDRVPYAFEKRVMAHLENAPAADSTGDWGRALWRAVTPCFGIMLLTVALSHNNALEDESVDFELENAVLAPGDDLVDFEA